MARTRGTIWLRPVRLRPCIREDGERSLGKQIAATRTCPAPSAGRAAMKADRILGHRDEQPSPLIQPPAISGISLRRSCCSTARCASMDPKRSQHGFRSSNTWNGRSPAHDRLATDRKWWTIRELQLIYQLQDAILVARAGKLPAWCPSRACSLRPRLQPPLQPLQILGIRRHEHQRVMLLIAAPSQPAVDTQAARLRQRIGRICKQDQHC